MFHRHRVLAGDGVEFLIKQKGSDFKLTVAKRNYNISS